MKTMYAVVLITDINGETVIQSILGIFKSKEIAKRYENNLNEAGFCKRYTTKEIETDFI